MEYARLEDTLYFPFGVNSAVGSGMDGATAVFDVRLSTAASSAAPVYSGSATLLTHANYPDGCWEATIPATTANGFVDGGCYAVFCTLAIDGQTPTGCIGKFRLGGAPVKIDQQLLDVLGVIDLGVAQGSSGSTNLQIRAAAAFPDNQLRGKTVIITSATTGAGQSSVISSNTLSGDALVVDPPWVTALTGTIGYVIISTPAAGLTLPDVNASKIANQTTIASSSITFPASVASSAGSGLDAAGVRAAVGLSTNNLDSQLTGINSKTTNLPASPAAVGSAMTLTSGERTSILGTFQADSDWKKMLGNVQGGFVFTPPVSYPGTGTLVLKANQDGSGATLLTGTLTFDANEVLISRVTA